MDASGFAAVIESLTADPEAAARLTETAFGRAVEFYDVQPMARRYRALLLG
jgi:hypothetical protein